MPRDFDKLRRDVLVHFESAEFFKQPGQMFRVQRKLAPAMIDFSIAAIKELEQIEADGNEKEFDDAIHGIAGSMATIVINLTKSMDDPQEAALNFLAIMLEDIVRAATGSVTTHPVKIEQKAH